MRVMRREKVRPLMMPYKRSGWIRMNAGWLGRSCGRNTYNVVDIIGLQ